MKKLLIATALISVLISCKKIEETVNITVTSAKEKAKQKAGEMVQETVNEQMNRFINADDVKFDSIFPHKDSLAIANETGKKILLPNGSTVYVFKFNTAEKEPFLNALVQQPSTDESKSAKQFSKIDGASFVQKIIFLEKFLPQNTIDQNFLDDLKNDKNIEFYRVKRFPNISTVIYNPKNQMVYQFVEVKK